MKHGRPDYDIATISKKIPPDEPVFLLRGQDMCAPESLRAYALEVSRQGGPEEVVLSALRQAKAMDKWQRTMFRKLPDIAS